MLINKKEINASGQYVMPELLTLIPTSGLMLSMKPASLYRSKVGDARSIR
jgi:hypothetical protein